MIINSLPYPEPDRLVRVGAGARLGFSVGLYHLLREMSDIAEDVGQHTPQSQGSLIGDAEPERVTIVGMSPTIFELIGVEPVLGKAVLPANFARGTASQSVVVSHGLWVRRFGSDPSIIGRTLVLNDRPREVIGVMPRGFAFPAPDIEIWVMNDGPPNRIGGLGRRGVARLKPGISIEEAEVRFNTVIPRLVEVFPQEAFRIQTLLDRNFRFHVVPLKAVVVGTVGQRLWVVFGAVVFVLLMACANVANLFLVRAEARQREIAVRTAVGASRRQLARHFLAEGIGLATVGGLLGLGLAIATVRVLVRFGPADLPRLHEVAVDPTVVTFTVAVALLSGTLFGAIALANIGSRVLFSLKDVPPSTTVGRSRFQVRNVLVVSQMAFALVLLVGSGLMIRSFWHLTKVDPGFDPTNVLTFDLRLSSEYDDDHVDAFHQELYERLGGLPGGVAVVGTTCPPVRPVCEGMWSLRDEGEQDFDFAGSIFTRFIMATSGYFEAMRIPLLSGRTFGPEPHDNFAVVVSETLAKVRWPGVDPIGRRVARFFLNVTDPAEHPPDEWYTIVGVVGDVVEKQLTDGGGARARIIYYRRTPRAMTVVMRTSTPPLDLIDAVRNTVWSMDAKLPVANIQTMDQAVRGARAEMAFTMVLIVIGGVAALLLGVIGIYGVITYMVGRRTHEIGIRMALGADASDVSRMVLRQGGSVVVVGVLIGLAGAFALTRVMESVVFGVSPTDPATYFAASIGLLVIALWATYLPARRAAKVDPVEALRAN